MLAIDPYQDGLPIGTEVALVGFDDTSLTKFVEGDPGATAYEPAAQGLFLSNADGRLLSVWDEGGGWPQIQTIADLSAALHT